MSRLITELKREHQFLVARIMELKKIVGSDDSGKALALVKKGLLAHLTKEDDKLYPVLRKAALDDKNLAELIDNFAKDMEQISKSALSFFAKYEHGVPEGIEFARDFGTLAAVLAKRIHSEETILYPEYDRLIDEGKASEAGIVFEDESVANALSKEVSQDGPSRPSKRADVVPSLWVPTAAASSSGGPAALTYQSALPQTPSGAFAAPPPDRTLWGVLVTAVAVFAVLGFFMFR